MMRGNQSSPTKDCKYLNRNSSENRIGKLNFREIKQIILHTDFSSISFKQNETGMSYQ